jgi:hypothetical protein
MPLSPGPNAPPPPGLGAPAEFPPPSTLGLAVGRLLGVTVLLVVEFPDDAGDVELPDAEELPAGVAEAEAEAAGESVTTLVMICVVVWRFESSPTLVLRTVDTGALVLFYKRMVNKNTARTCP